MSDTSDGVIIIFSSLSGAGKTTLVKLLEKQEDFSVSVSHTTRKPRSKEIDGKDYYFVDNKQFNQLIKKNEFLEYAKVFNNLYGTLKKPVFEKLQRGENILFDIDWQGAKIIRSQNIKYKIFSFFVLPPSKEILFERLSNRDMKDKLIVSERMKDFYNDVKHWIDYDYVVINDDLNECFKEIMKIITNFIKSKSIIKQETSKIKIHVDKLLS